MNTKKEPFIVIAGPCVIESMELLIDTALELKKITTKYQLPFYFKSSFDKANRSSINSFRGPGLTKGLNMLSKIKEKTGCALTTDVHLPDQVKPVAQIVDILQVPAYLCRQTDLILACGESGKIVNVKKGQFLAPDDVDLIAEKLQWAGCKNFFFTERGSCFGYHDLIVDMRGIVRMRSRKHKVIFDATHSVQRPSALGKQTGGEEAMAFPLARAAVSIGIDGLFFETHPYPEKAMSDASTMIPLGKVDQMLECLLKIHEAVP
ncbi:2-dehydro-3-deoxyphosphooctonate aldolase [Methylacidiphilum kamchatkense Kam1]|uniref:3-deoxy-8-phosphooctulonate synthase n=1 Tax=Methylacidiphilum kamchatkense Kam1 TaxID=1202785 RepID=A0A0C1UR93_9BACT|nr:3-deoxy-8-phosphooctulonate synthase [Methylacidiphilum kamchatkense]KIE58378.1 2-dehydro-3-deoxyphosphooctonate aldolase [Methylacidiphilum kamchatkense Kam1]QDQ42216.1 2-dehydro-3-deoxyphosphooctonate aldolase (KDO 8-P synthase) [Methylacidiphilum kamchatkense Kam1]